MSLIRFDGVTKTFDDLDALADVSFDVGEGEIVALIGPSGSGKTTAVRLVTGTYAPTSGSVEVLGEPAAELSTEIRSSIGYLPQQPALLPGLSLIDNLRFHASLVGLPRRAQHLDEALALVDLGEHRSTKVRDASGGMQRRLALVASLLHDPSLALLDEPTAGIDPVLRQQIWEHLEARRAEGTTLVVTTQYLGEALRCDRVAVVSDGRLIGFDTPKALRHDAFGGDRLDVELDDVAPAGLVGSVAELPGVRRAPKEVGPRSLEVVVDDAGAAAGVIGTLLADRGIGVRSIEERFVDFDSVFVELIERARAEGRVSRPSEVSV